MLMVVDECVTREPDVMHLHIVLIKPIVNPGRYSMSRGTDFPAGHSWQTRKSVPHGAISARSAFKENG